MQNQIIHQSSWALSANGQALSLYKKAHSVENRLHVLLIGGVHGDEPEGVYLATNLLAWLEKQDQNRLLNWTLIPNFNPDGFAKNERTNGHGVDLNRNFPSRDWSAEAKGPRYHPGPHPGSEPETQALVKLLQQNHYDVIVHFHSWEPCVVYTGDRGKIYAEILGADTPYEVREDIGYPTPGSLGQYGWLEHRTPVVCIEAQEGDNPENVWRHFSPGLIRLLEST